MSDMIIDIYHMAVELGKLSGTEEDMTAAVMGLPHGVQQVLMMKAMSVG